MTEYIDVTYSVVLSVHEDDVPTAGEIAEAIWDHISAVHDQDAISVERVVDDAL